MWDRTTTASTSVAALLACGLASATGLGQSKPGPPPLPPALDMLWQHAVTLPEGAKETPALAAGSSLLFLNSADMGLTAYAPDDGRVLWSSEYVSSLAAVAFGGRIAVASRGVLVIVDQDTSVPAWQANLPGTPTSIFAFNDRVGAVVGNEILIWSGPGEPMRTPLGATPVTRVVFHQGVLYVGLAEPSLVAIDAASGAIRWRIPTPAKALSLAADDERLYLAADDAAIYAYRTSGEAKWDWRFPRRIGIRGEPSVDDRFVYFALMDNTVRAFNRKGGSERWTREIGSRPKSGPILLGSTLAVALETGHVVELAATSGQIRTAAAPPQLAKARLQAVAETSDHSQLYTLATAKDESKILTAWGRPKPKGPRP